MTHPTPLPAVDADVAALRGALEHIQKTCIASRSQTRRIRWIEARARGALAGDNHLHRNIDLPKDGGPDTAEKLKNKLLHERFIHRIEQALTTGILQCALSAAQARAEAVEKDAARLDALARPGWELSQNNDPEARPDELWQVHRVSGGRNDREWTLIGQGANLRAAIDSAIGGKGA